jgi:hypothetical protein
MGELSPLPRSLDPLPGESLPGYLLRLAHRLGLAPARVLQLTGLTAGTGHLQAPRGLMMHLDAAAAGLFARTTRLTAAEIAGLCMSSMSGRYPQAAPVITSARPVTSPWVFTSATRYCPQCLTGDDSPVQRQHGGAWHRTWRLPVVFACPLHRRLLEHLCPSCGQPAMSALPSGQASLIPHSTSSGLHPAQCRAVPQPERGAPRARLCQARLDSPPEISGAEDSAGLDDLLALQARLLALLQPEGPATVMSVGRPAATAQYFADLRLICSLISGAWPASRNLIPAPGLTAVVDDYITGLSSVNPRPYRLCDTPPLDPRPSAALIAAATRIPEGGDLRIISEFVTPARNSSSRQSPRGRWIRRYQRAGRDCSDGFRDAPEPLVNTFQRTDQRSRGRRAPARQVSFAPEHIPGHLQDNWFRQHFHHIGGIRPRLLRRAAALRLVQMAAGGSLAGAAAFLGIDHRYIAASPGSSAFAGGPAEFRLAVHALALELSATPSLTDYKHRRDALRTWCIDPAAWQDIIDQLPRTKGPFQPELSDCKRQFATEAVWARITQGEHVMAPQLIEAQLSRPDPTWNRRRDNMWHFYRAHPAKPHHAALKEILSAHADNLAAAIDHRPRLSLGHAIDHGDK